MLTSSPFKSREKANFTSGIAGSFTNLRLFVLHNSLTPAVLLMSIPDAPRREAVSHSRGYISHIENKSRFTCRVSDISHYAYSSQTSYDNVANGAAAISPNYFLDGKKED